MNKNYKLTFKQGKGYIPISENSSSFSKGSKAVLSNHKPSKESGILNKLFSINPALSIIVSSALFCIPVNLNAANVYFDGVNPNTSNPNPIDAEKGSKQSGYNLAIGYNSKATGGRAIAIGHDHGVIDKDNKEVHSDTHKTIVDGDQSIGIGAGVHVTSRQAVGIGNDLDVTGIGAVAIGGDDMGSLSTSLGWPRTTASGAGSIALGVHAKSTATGSLAIGAFSGASAENSLAMIWGSKASGTKSIAIGEKTIASGNSSLALMQGARTGNVNVTNSTTNEFAQNSGSQADNAIAIGKDALAKRNNTIALGTSTQANTDNAVAIGNNSIAENTNDVSNSSYYTIAGFTSTQSVQGTTANSVFSVGSSTVKRQIQNVAAGVVSATSTDAINGSQLYATADTLKKYSDTIGWKISDGGNNNAEITNRLTTDKDYTTITFTGDGATSVTFNPNTKTFTISTPTATIDNSNGNFSTTNGSRPVTAESVKDNLNALKNLGLKFSGNVGSEVAKKLGETLEIVSGDVTNGGTFLGKNLKTEADSTNGIKIGFSDNPEFSTVTTGDKSGNNLTINGNTIQGKSNATTNTTGIQFDNNYITLTNAGATNSSVVLKNIAKGSVNTSSTDAINGAQLFSLASVVGVDSNIDMFVTPKFKKINALSKLANNGGETEDISKDIKTRINDLINTVNLGRIYAADDNMIDNGGSGPNTLIPNLDAKVILETNNALKKDLGEAIYILSGDFDAQENSTTVNYKGDNLATSVKDGKLYIGMKETPSFKSITLGDVSSKGNLTFDKNGLKIDGQEVGNLHYVSIKSTEAGTGSNYQNDEATANNAIAIGPNASSSSESSIVVGNKSKISDSINSGIFGNTNIISSANIDNTNYSGAGKVYVVGDSNTLKNNTSTSVFGISNIINHSSNTQVLGNENQLIDKQESATSRKGSDNAQVIGNKNILENATGSVIIGDSNQSKSNSTIIIGNENNTASSNLASVIGSKNTSSGAAQYGILGYANTVNRQNSYAIGNNNNIAFKTEDNEGSFVLGNNVKIENTITNSVFLGSKSTMVNTIGKNKGYDTNNAFIDGTTTTGGSTGQIDKFSIGTGNKEIIYGKTPEFAGATSIGGVSVGYAGGERRIMNVAAGEISPTSTDAVNGSQLYAVALKNYTPYFSVNSTEDGNYKNDGASGTNAMAIGPNAKATAEKSISLGYNSGIVSDKAKKVDTSIANLTTTGISSISIGENSLGSGINSIAIGRNTYATNERSLAIGGNNDDKENLNSLTIVSGIQSVGIGSGLLVKGNQSVGIGNDVKTFGYGAIAIGGDDHGEHGYWPPTIANGDASVALGVHSQAIGKNSLALGADARAGTTSSDTSKGNDIKDKLAVKNGEGEYALAIMAKSKAQKDKSIAIGFQSDSQNERAIAIGDESVASLNKSVAIGSESKATTLNTSGNFVYMPDGSTSNQSVAASPNGSGISVFSVGSDTVKRQIQNVAAGVVSENSTDAINGSQLHFTALNLKEYSDANKWIIAGNDGNEVNKIGKDNKVQFINGTGTTASVIKDTTTNDTKVTFNINKALVPLITNGSFAGTRAENTFYDAPTIDSMLQNIGWKVSGKDSANTAQSNLITTGKEVEFVAGDNAKVEVDKETNGKTTIKISSIIPKVETVTLEDDTAKNDGSIVTPNENDKNKFVTADNLVKTINYSLGEVRNLGIDFSADNFADTDGTTKVHKGLGEKLEILSDDIETDYKKANLKTAVKDGKIVIGFKDKPIFSEVTADKFIAGGVVISKDNGINAGGKAITNVGTPTNDNDAVNKGYVDNHKWIISGNDGNEVNKIGKDNKVQFINGTGTTANVANDNGTTKVTFNVNVANKPNIGTDGIIPTNTNGKNTFYDAPTIDSMLNAIGWNISGANDKNKHLITTGKQVEFVAGDNTSVEVSAEKDNKTTVKISSSTPTTALSDDTSTNNGNILTPTQGDENKFVTADNLVKTINHSLDEVRNLGLDFSADNFTDTDDTTKVHKNLGEKLEILSDDIETDYKKANLKTAVKDGKVVIGFKDKPTFSEVTVGDTANNNLVLSGNSIQGKNNSTNTTGISFGNNNNTVSLLGNNSGVKLSNVAAGAISGSSLDAINGKQLFSLGGILGLAPENSNDTNFGNPTFTALKDKKGSNIVTTNPISYLTTINNITGRLNDGIIFNGNSGNDNNAAQYLGSKLNIVGSEKVTGGKYSSNNITTDYTKDDEGNGIIKISMSDKPKFDEVTAPKFSTGDNGPILTGSGLDAASTNITNLADGVNAGDAVNKGQLDNAVTNINNTIEANKIKYFSVNSKVEGNSKNDGAKGTNAIAIGPKASVTNDYSLAMGYNASATGQFGIAIGESSKSEGNLNVAIGSEAEVKELAIAVGYGAVADKFSTSIGSQAKANGAQFAQAIGTSAVLTELKDGENTIVAGKTITINNKNSGNISGTSVKKLDVVEEDDKTLRQKYGNLYLSMAVGTKASAHDLGATAIGAFSTATHKHSIALGNSAQAFNEYAIAIGDNTLSQAANSIALGRNSEALSINSIDGKAVYSEEYVKAITGVVSVGNEKDKRRIINVAGGINDNDAVNVKQLKAAKTEVESTDSSVNITERQGDNKQTIYDLSVNKATLNISPDGKNITSDKKDNAFVTGENVANIVNKATASARTEVIAGKNVDVIASNGADGHDIYDINVSGDLTEISSIANGATKISLDKDKNEVNVNNAKITNVTDGDISETSKDAINGSQIHALKNELNKNINAAKTEVVSNDGSVNIKEQLGKNNQTIYDLSVVKSELTISSDGKTITSNTPNNAFVTGDNVANIVNKAVASARTEVKDGINTKVNKETGTDGHDIYKVDVKGDLEEISSITNGDTKITLGKDNDNKPLVDVNNAKITNIANGDISKDSKDAVTGGQLFDEAKKLDDKINNSVAELDKKVAAAKTEVTGTGAAIVTETKGDNGQAIYKVHVDKPIQFTTADGTQVTKVDDKFYKLKDGKPDETSEVNPKDIIVSMVNPDGTSTTPTKITNVDKGIIADNSHDAVNGSQLKDLGDKLGLSVNDSGDGFKAPTFNNVLKDEKGGDKQPASPQTVTKAIDDIIDIVNKGLNFAGNTGNGTQNLGSSVNVVGSVKDNNSTYSSNNITTTYVKDSASGNGTITIEMKENPTFAGSVTSKEGFVVENGPSMTKDGINAGDKKITNVANGTNPNDAANISQIKDVVNTLILGASYDPNYGVIDIDDKGDVHIKENVNIGGTGQNNVNDAIAAIHAGNMRLNDMVNKNKRAAEAGIANALAVGNLPQSTIPGKGMLSIGYGAYKGQSAAALGISKMSDSGKWVFKGAMSYDAQKSMGAAASVGFHW